ncbi:5'/3'-nucleotidase SurE [Desulfopila inferna]|uniref:5'/3'-nucleotidase SurE n=1 Tax=Desulfopila inferna TaxID=468528 RepID=UPI0019666DF2|nr:5'/3'-nucleotidase SurE [Desulfopila inferna]MBM9603870.1 5'/3'-nucleotidase SurE [Desulfopila inferna]
MTTILLTNDDGFTSDGIRALFQALQQIGRVMMVAPDRDKSAVSHSLTMHRPLRVKHMETDIIAIDGTPTDCVALALQKILKTVPDLLVSGINNGPNLGDDISYSGTVSAALEGTMHAVPSLAVSMTEKTTDYRYAAAIAAELAKLTLSKGLPENTLLNINIPAEAAIKGVRVTRQGRRMWRNAIQETTDPWGRKLFWIGGGSPYTDSATDTDIHAVKEGYVSVTPIHIDKTNHEGIFQLRDDWQLEKNGLQSG